MLFAISTDESGRAILDDDLHGDVVVVIEAKTWQCARCLVLAQEAMDPYKHRAGFGWFKRDGLKEAPIEGDNK